MRFSFQTESVNCLRLLMSEIDVESSGNFDWYVVRDAQARADESSRYSNTLLVSLNNRIYFRDHPFRGTQVSQDNSRCPAPTVTVTQISFAQNGLSHATSTSDGSGTESTTDIEKGAVIGDDPNPRFVIPSQHVDQAVQHLWITVNEKGMVLLIPMHLKSLLLKGWCFFGVQHLTVIVMGLRLP